MQIKLFKSPLALVMGIALSIVVFATACNSGGTTNSIDSTTVKPADTTPAPDTTHMDTATTRPVKGGN